jgi:hypothetical protein
VTRLSQIQAGLNGQGASGLVKDTGVAPVSIAPQ